MCRAELSAEVALDGRRDVVGHLSGEKLGERAYPPDVAGHRDGLVDNPNVRMALLGDHGSPWPWESMHVEALARFDYWLKATRRPAHQDVLCSRSAAPSRSAGEPVDYRIPLVATARRFAAGNRIRLTLTSNDNLPDSKPMLGFYHTPVGPASTNTVHATSRLLLPVAAT